MPDQRSLAEQMASLRRLAITDGLYDADDWLIRTFPWPQGYEHCEVICEAECIGACGV